jgi:BirA family biotin operon repressor/biotin-[acetyl-CoA-carboxylase] ligase
MKEKILKKLRNSQEYISGQAICDDLGISRTAVWKYVNQLKEEGYEIESVQNKGYRITKYPDIITKAEIESCLSDNLAVKQVFYADELDSTNNEAKRMAEKNGEDGTLYIAECQTGGRGRRGRTWLAPKGSSITMSLLLRPDINPASASMLTIVAAMAVTAALRSVAGDVPCRIKWPNDVVVDKKKVCGILTEMSAEVDYIHYVVIGIGINVNTTDFDDSIKDMASSVYLQTGKKIKRSSIVVAFAKEFTRFYDEFLKTGDLSGLADEYNEMLINAGQQVKISDVKTEFTGTAIGINNHGELLVRLDDGSETAISAGEVSVRGLYGYV